MGAHVGHGTSGGVTKTLVTQKGFRMATRRIDEPKKELDPNNRRTMCQHSEHEPPNAQVLAPGSYEHVCPGCGHVGHFTVSKEPRL